MLPLLPAQRCQKRSRSENDGADLQIAHPERKRASGSLAPREPDAVELVPAHGPPVVAAPNSDAYRLLVARFTSDDLRCVRRSNATVRARIPLASPQLDVALAFVRDRRLPAGIGASDKRALEQFATGWPLPALSAALQQNEATRDDCVQARGPRPCRLGRLPLREPASGVWRWPPAGGQLLEVDVRGTLLSIDADALLALEEGEPLATMLGLRGEWNPTRRGGRPFLDLSSTSFAQLARFVSTGTLSPQLTPQARGVLAQDASFLCMESVVVESETLFPLRQAAAKSGFRPRRLATSLALFRLGDAIHAVGSEEEAERCWRRALLEARPDRLERALQPASWPHPSRTPAERGWLEYHARSARALQRGLEREVLFASPAELGDEAAPPALHRLRGLAALLAHDVVGARAHLADLLPPASGRPSAALPTTEGDAAGPTLACLQARAVALARARPEEPACLLFLAALERRDGSVAHGRALAALLAAFPTSAWGQVSLAAAAAVGEPTALHQLRAVVERAPFCRTAYLQALWPALLAGNWPAVAALVGARRRFFGDELSTLALCRVTHTHVGEVVEQSRFGRRMARRGAADPMVALSLAWASVRAGDAEAVVRLTTRMAAHARAAPMTLRHRPELWRWAAQALLAVGERPAALSLMAAAVRTYGDDTGLLLEECEALQAAGRLGEAARSALVLARAFASDAGWQQRCFCLLLEADEPALAARFWAQWPAGARSLDARVSLAAAWRRTGQLHEAQAEVHDLLVDAPEHAAGWLERARCQLARSDLAHARRAFDCARHCAGEPFALALFEVQLLAAEGDRPAAIAACEALIRRQPEQAEPYRWLERLYARDQRPGHFGPFLRALPGAPATARLELASWYNGLKRHEEALQVTRALAAEGSTGPLLWSQQTESLLGLGRFAEALAPARRAATAVRPPAHAALSYGLALFSAGLRDAALRWFHESTRKEQDAPSWRILGEAQLLMQAPRAAVYSLEAAVALEADSASAHQLLGRAHLALEEHEQAWEAAERAAALDLPLDQRASNDAVRARAAIQGDPWSHTAEQAVRRALAHGEPSADLLAAVGRLWLARGNTQRARRWLRRALALDAQQPDANEAMAQLLERSGQHGPAAEAWQRAAAARPRHAAYPRRAARAFRAIGDDVRAHRCLQQALAIDPDALSTQAELAALCVQTPIHEAAFHQGRRLLDFLIAQAPENADFRRARRAAELRLTMGPGAEARTWLPAAETDEDEALAFVGTLLEQRAPSVAAHVVDLAVAQNADSPRLVLLQWRTHALAGRPLVGFEALRKRLVARPHTYKRDWLATAALHLSVAPGQPAPALFADGLRRWPTCARVLTAVACGKGERWPRASQALSRMAARLQPKESQLLANALWTAFATDDAAAALTFGQRCLDADDDTQMDEAALAWALRSEGRLGEALAWGNACWSGRARDAGEVRLAQELCATLMALGG